MAEFGASIYSPTTEDTTDDPLDLRGHRGGNGRLSRYGTGDAEQGSEMTEPTTSFADSGEAAISQKIEVSPDLFASSLSADEFAEYYDIDRTANGIAEGGYKCVRPIPC